MFLQLAIGTVLNGDVGSSTLWEGMLDPRMNKFVARTIAMLVC